MKARDVVRFVVAAACLLAVQGFHAARANGDAEPVREEYRRAGEESLTAWVFRPRSSEPAPAILLFHGGGWQAGSAEWTFGSAQRFAALGLVAIAVDYRLARGAVTPIDAVDDACAAFAWTRTNAARLGVDPRRLVGYGVSAGGHIVATAATAGCPSDADGRREPVHAAALLLYSPALDTAADAWFAKLLQGRAEPEDYSPLEHAGATSPATLIVQGDADTLTRPSGAIGYCERLRAAGRTCELAMYAGVGHLLTRNLKNQEDDFDPDPKASADAIVRQRNFLAARGLIDPARASVSP